jgi:protein phosphatase
MSGRPVLRFGFVSHAGLERERNEDAFVVYAPYEGEAPVGSFDALFVVADGMGGHESGDVASRLVADSAASALTMRMMDDDIDPAAHIEDVVRRADAELRDLVRTAGLQSAAGSTLTLAALRGYRLHVGHVGDSRAYRLRAGDLTQLTEDHSWVADQVRAGLLSPEEAAVHPKRNLLTHSLGVGRDLRVFSATHEIVSGDRYMICTDGLHGVVPTEIVARVLSEETDAQSAAARLVSIANEGGGPDNITCVVFDVHAPPEQTTVRAVAEVPDARRLSDTLSDAPASALSAASGRRPRRVLPHALVAAGVVLVTGAAALAAWRYLDARPRENANAVTPAVSTATVPDSSRTGTASHADSARDGVAATDTTRRAARAVPDSARDPPSPTR